MAKENFVQRIKRGVLAWQKLTEKPREHAETIYKYYASGYFKGKAAQQAHPINLIDRGLSILAPYLCMGNPRILVSTKISQLKPWAYTTELAIHHLFDEINFAQNTIRPTNVNSFFTMGITKCGITKEDEVYWKGYLHDLGQPYCDNVSFEDYIGDSTARNREEMEFEGNRYWIPTQIAREIFPRFADELTPDYKFDRTGPEGPEQIAKEDVYNFNGLRERTEFWDVYLPQEDVIITLRPHGDRIINTVPWDGPEGGPYEVLGYKYFPDSVIPIPPAFGWLDLDTLINTAILKARKQANREKEILAYSSMAADDAERIAMTPDGGTCRVDNVDRMKNIKYGGVNDALYQWVTYAESQFSLQGGNLYVLGGRNVMAETLGQEQMMQANASRMLDDMMNQSYSFWRKNIRKIAWFLWTDPLINIPLIKEMKGIGSIQVFFSQEAKEGDFYDFNFEIEPYSTQRMTPDVKYNKLMMILSQWVLPTAQIAASQGYQLDVGAVTRELARYLEIKDLDTWYRSATPSMPDLNPYQPMKGVALNTGVSDGRTGILGVPSRNANRMQQQARAGGESSPKNTEQGE